MRCVRTTHASESGRRRAGGRRRVIRAVAWVALLAALALIGLGIALRAGAFGHDAPTAPSTSQALRPTTTPLTTTAAAATTAATTTTATSTQAVVPVTFVVQAARGDSWMEVRIGTQHGPRPLQRHPPAGRVRPRDRSCAVGALRLGREPRPDVERPAGPHDELRHGRCGRHARRDARRLLDFDV